MPGRQVRGLGDALAEALMSVCLVLDESGNVSNSCVTLISFSALHNIFTSFQGLL